MKVTTINIIEVNASKQKLQLIEIESENIQGNRLSLYVTSFTRMSLNKDSEKTNAKNTLNVVNMQTPKPRERPNNPPLKKPIKGKKTIKNNIKLKKK